ncbi:anti-silencing protein ASF 1 like protein [Perkinsela sp. CCAP 1560/4]|nr:anti-silencing protein ASF 1 like protein [Perkinsela sp. CCAP 1560/4]|eukprot:KNH04049.1 anti-silencing protein ASF 1 like protein [Perkinsela sp. CCAP 1560/4]
MASIQLKEIELQSENPSAYTNPFRFRITVDVLEELQEDLEVIFVWVGSCESKEYDQKLDEILIGPLQLGTNEFVAEIPAPNWSLIPPWDLLGVTLLLITFNYREREFMRVGYWVEVSYMNSGESGQMPQTIEINHIQRNILLMNPTVRSNAIIWDSEVAIERDAEDSVSRDA